MKEMVGGCCVCSDDRGWSENPLVYCDGQSCTVAVHQACYGIVTVPTGPWYCRKCESQERSVKVKCELCPSKYGALKRTDNSGWAHVVCALYIPEVRFGNVTTMEPIQLQLIPAERFNKVCYICEEKGKPSNATIGACMQCNKAGCKQQFHVTCAQGLGLLCEEAGNYLDNVKYCGYCQHHYSKLKKGGNVKTIPPYKPIGNEAHNSDSNSEKEPETASSKNHISPPVNKKRSGVSGKTTPSKASNKSNTSQQKTVHNNKNSDKTKVSNSSSSTSASSKSDKSAEPSITSADQKSDKKDQKSVVDSSSVETTADKDNEVVKDNNRSSRKRKANSRTPTPVSLSVSASDISAVVTPITNTSSPSAIVGVDNQKSTVDSDIGPGKIRKPKLETSQPLVTNQPVVALTSIATVKATSPTVVEPVSAPEIVPQSQALAAAQIQSQSLVVSVPLVNTALTDHHSIVGSGGQVATLPNALMPERSNSVGSVTERMSVISSGGNSDQGLLPSEMSVGGLKLGYEKQVDSINTVEDMELELEPSPSAIVEEPMTRSRAQSNDKTERPSRGKKRNTNGNTGNNQQVASSSSSSAITNTQTQKRSSRSQHISPSPEVPGAFAAISQTQLKSSPPRTPSPEGNSSSRSSRSKGRKSAPASLSVGGGGIAVKDSKDIKLFQNGLTAPHMLGNQLNPTSTMHSKMNEHLNSELEAHSIFNQNDATVSLVGPPLQHKIIQSTRASSTGSSTASGSSGLSSMLGGGGGGNIPQTLDQLLERQWEQGSQFLMEQAQHFDIASLLSCLHQLRAENMRLEDHVSSLLQRRDHLLAVNARLAIPLTGQPPVTQPPTVNNIHPQVTVNDDLPRSHVRTNSGSRYPNQGPSDQPLASHEDVRSSHRSSSGNRYSGSSQHPPVDNGLPDGYPHGSQHSPTVRW